MYFVVRGELEVFAKDGETLLHVLSDGDFFGEIALYMKSPRTATVKAVSYCDLYTLSKRSMKHVVEKYPEIGQKIEAQIKQTSERDSSLRN